MHFLHPWFLAGVATIGVPIAIHFVFKMRARVVPFPSVRFLKAIERRVSRRRRIEELLVLALRCLALVLVAIGISGPVLKAAGGTLGSSGTAVAIVLDDSYSLGLREPSGPIFARARGLTLSILHTLRPGDQACVLTSRREASLSRDVNALAAELTTLEPSEGAGTLRPLVEAGLALLGKADAAQRELYIVSDFQRRACDLEGVDWTLRDGTVIAVPVGAARHENCAVTALERLSPLATTTAPLRVRATIANRGAETASPHVRIRLDGVVSSEQMVVVGPGASVTQAASIAIDRAGSHTITAELEADALPADDRRFLAVDVRPRVRVLVLRPEAEGPRSRAFYLERALNPGGAAETGVELVSREPGAARDDLSEYACVFLVEATPPDAESLAMLRGYVASGGSLVVVAGPDVDATEWNRVLAASPDALGPLAPGQLLGVVEEKDPEAAPRTIAEVDATHPIFARLRRAETPIDLGSASFYRLPRLEASDEPGTRVLARFSDKSPAVVERPFGLGRTILLAPSLHADSTNLPLRVSFLPFVQGVLAYLSVPGKPDGLLVGDRIVLRVPADGAPASAKLYRTPRDFVEAPRVVSADVARFDFGPAWASGVQTLEWLAPERIESRTIAVNVDPEEGVQEYADAATVLPRARRVTSADDLAALVTQIRHGQGIGPHFALLALVVLLVEAFLANRLSFGRLESQGALRFAT
jgi:hypothetical protein